MTLTPRDIQILIVLAAHYTLTAAQIHRLLFAGKDISITRRRLNALRAARLINRTQSEVVVPGFGLTCPVYYPSRVGLEALAAETRDERYLLAPTQTPAWQNLAHFVGLSELRITIQQAVALQSVVSLAAFYNEFDVVNQEQLDPAKRFRLYTLLREKPKLVCVPDAAFALQSGPICKAFYVELHRRDSARKAAAEKAPGYGVMAAARLHRRHFPQAFDEFSVLVFSATAGWRDLLRKEFAKKDSSHLYWFAALTETTPEKFFAPIFYSCTKGPFSLLHGGDQ